MCESYATFYRKTKTLVGFFLCHRKILGYDVTSLKAATILRITLTLR